MKTIRSAKVGQNTEFPIPRKEEALNSRNLGGETRPDFPAEKPVVGSDGRPYPRNTVGAKSKYPLQVSRPGERRI